MLQVEKLDLWWGLVHKVQIEKDIQVETAERRLSIVLQQYQLKSQQISFFLPL